MLLARLGIGIGHAVSLPALALVGLCVGIIAGMYGVGGGFLLTPILIYVFGVPPAVAIGSSLSQQCGTSVASFVKYRKLKRGDPRIDLVMVGGSLIGVDAGARLLSHLARMAPIHMPDGHVAPAISIVIDVLFLLMLTYTAVFVLRDAVLSLRNPVMRGDKTIPGPLAKIRIPPYIDLPDVELSQVSVPLLSILGFVLGVASGVMGIGGGVLLMPILLYGFGLSARNAAGTGILMLAATVALGTIEQALRGYVSLPLAMVILIGSSIGSQIGANITHRLPNRYLRLIFGCLVVAVITLIGWNLYGLLFR